MLRYRLGELWGEPLGRARSRRCTTSARRSSSTPSSCGALYEARQLCLAAGDLRGAAELYEREASAEPTLERKVALLRS